MGEEIEITSAMIAAGVSELSEWSSGDRSSYIVESVFDAMWKASSYASRKADPLGDQAPPVQKK